jgi:hypothetical protein
MKKGDELRPHLERLLDDLEAAPPPPDRWYPEGTVVRVPAYRDGKLIGHVTESVEEFRGTDEWDHHINSVRRLRAAIEAGDDVYLIAWLALQVGGGTQLPSVIFEDNNLAILRDNGANSRKAPPDAELYAAVEEKMKRRGLKRTPAADYVAKDLLARGLEITGRTVRDGHKRHAERLGLPLSRKKRPPG